MEWFFHTKGPKSVKNLRSNLHFMYLFQAEITNRLTSLL